MNEADSVCPGCGNWSLGGEKHLRCKGYLDGLLCEWEYEGVVRKAISESKFRFHYDILTEMVDRMELITGKEDLPFYVTWVPLAPDRHRWRGFNQAEIIAQLWAKRQGWSCGKLLIKVRNTGFQVGRTREERLAAMKGAFKAKVPAGVARVLIVDDVWTTGATLQECAKALRVEGVKTVWGLVLAR